MAAKHGLGRGLEMLIKDTPTAAAPDAGAPAANTIPLDKIRNNPNQPRQHFSTEAIQELAESIKSQGILQPLLLRKVKDGYELIAGERRMRAAKLAGLSEVPATVKDVSERDALEISLIENLQREDLNAIEEAEGYQKLLVQFRLTQDAIAQVVGKARATVTNAMRLLELPDEIKQMLIVGRLSSGHAKVLLGVPINEEKCIIARRAADEGWSVRYLEKAVTRLACLPKKPRAMRSDIPASHLQHLSDKLHQHFGTNVHLTPSKTLANGKKTKGSIEIDYYSNEDLTRILDLLGISIE